MLDFKNLSAFNTKMFPYAQTVHFTDADLVVDLTDGRTVSVPLSWFASLSNASKKQLNDFQILGDGEGIHWPQLDEDLSVKGLLLRVHSSIIEDWKFLKYAEISEKDGYAYFTNYPKEEPEGTGFVYLWIEISGDFKTIKYIGKAGQKMFTRCSQHIGGFKGASKSKAGKRNSQKICTGISEGKSYHVYYRKSDIKDVLGEKISMHSAEEEALIKKLREKHKQILWNK